MQQANPTRLKQQKNMFATIFPYENRHCTDVCCIIIGLIFSVAIFTFAIISHNSLHINQTSLPSDTTGKVCGIDYPKYSFVYFVNPPDISQRVCVSKCPAPGSAKLSCVAAGNIGCSFSETPGFTVAYYENQQFQGKQFINPDNNGNFCMPTDPQMKTAIQTNAKLDRRLVFFNSYYTLVMCLGLAVGASILFALLVQCIPKIMAWLTIYASLFFLIGLAVVLFFYKTENPSKIYISIALAVLFILIFVSAYVYTKQTKIGAIFLEQGTNFIASNLSTIFYIILFCSLTLGLFFMIIKEYEGLISIAKPDFDANQDIYYEVNSKGLWIVWIVLGIQFLWGLSFLKESFNFCMSNHAVRYYMKKGAGMCSIPETLQLLIFKHLGSVIGGAFINVFFFLPDMLLDFFRKDTNNDENQSGSCVTFFDLVRNDGMAYVALTGNPYCQSAKYCEYFTHESLLCEGSQSVLRLYRICAHVLIAGLVSISGLYIKGAIQPYTVGLTIIIGIFTCTYIISYQADPSEALLMMYSIEQQYNTKRSGEAKQPSNLKDNAQRVRYLNWLSYKGKQLSLANQVKDLKEEEWKEQGVSIASRVDDRIPIQQVEIPKQESHNKQKHEKQQDEYNEPAQI